MSSFQFRRSCGKNGAYNRRCSALLDSMITRRNVRQRLLAEIDDLELTDVNNNSSRTPRLREFRNRNKFSRENYSTSCWGIFIQKDFSDIESRNSKNFRNRFAVPFQTHKDIVILAKEWFPLLTANDAFGKPSAPVELKILGWLRMLAKGCSWDLLYELSGISAEVHRNFALKFSEKFSQEMYHIYVHGPRDAEEIEKITRVYAACGFPGCVGSVDCVHFRWDMCPAALTSLYRNGKYSYPTISFEMTCDHTKKIQACTKGHYGTSSDKTIVHFDGFVNAVEFDELFTKSTFKLQINATVFIVEEGLYLFCDGGYHKWRILQCQLKHTSGLNLQSP